MLEVKKPTTKEIILIWVSYRTKSPIKKTSAPKIVGIANKKANFDESFKFNPINKAAVIAVPDLDAPGNKAKTWNIPIKIAPAIVSSIKLLDEALYLYAKSKKPANKRFMYAMLAILFLFDSIKSVPSRPATTIGIVAIINKYASFLLSFKLLFLEIKDLIISLISVLKKYITATSVPAWTAISNANPRSSVPNNKAGNNKCAELEIGKNSVNPCIKPKRKLRRTSFIYFFVLRYWWINRVCGIWFK